MNRIVIIACIAFFGLITRLPAFAATDPLLQLSTGGASATTRTMLLNNDESLLISGGDDKVIRIWDTRTMQQVREIRGQVSIDIQGAVNAMALSPDERWLAVSIFFPHLHNGAEKRGYLRIHDFATGQLMKILEGHTKAMQSLTFSSDGSMLLGGESLEDNPKALIWDTSTWRVKQEFNGHQDGISGVAFTPDLTRVITSSWDRTIRIWDTATGKNLKTIQDAHGGRIYGALIPPNAGKPLLVTGSADKTVKVWDYETGKTVKTLKFKRRIRKVLVDSTGTRLLASSVGEQDNAWIAVMDVKSGKRITRYDQHDRTARGMVMSRDDETVYSSGGFRHEIDRWQISSARQTMRTVGAGKPVQAVGISEDGQILYWGQEPIDWSGKKYNFNKLAALSMQLELKTIHNQLGTPQRMKQSSGGINRTIRKAGRYTLKRERPSGSRFYSVLKIRKGGTTVGRIERNKRTGHIHTAFTFTPDGKKVITGGEVGYLSLHALDGKKIGDFKGHNSDITDLALSEDGSLLISGSRDQTFKLWNVNNQELLLSFFVADNGEWIAWTATGHYASSPNGDRYIGWVINQGVNRNSQYVRAEQMKDQLYRPDIIQKVLGSQSLFEALDQSAQSDFSVVEVVEKKVIPVNFDLLSPQSGYVTDEEAVELKVQVTENTKRDIDWSVTVNQRQVLNPSATRGLARTKPAGQSLGFPILLDPGENVIRILANNSETEKELTVMVTRNVTTPVNKGVAGEKLLIVSVGVNEYINLPDQSLQFASADAEAIAKTFIAQQGKEYDVVETIVLSDSNEQPATRDNIVDALDQMADLGPKDTVILFLAGHGIIEDDQYYFLPRDATLGNSNRWKKSTVVAWSEIQGAMQRSLGRRILLVDTCHAESAFNSRLVKDAEDSNIIVMSATDSATLAQEISSLGHGVFTYALVDGLNGKADSFEDKRITMTELNAFVANSVPSITQNSQIPTLSVPGGFQDFVVAQL